MIKIGDRILYKINKEYFSGIVIEINLWGRTWETLDMENHGYVAVKITDVGNSKYLEIGDTETICAFGSEKYIKLIKEK